LIRSCFFMNKIVEESINLIDHWKGIVSLLEPAASSVRYRCTVLRIPPSYL
jgi:hypothetical protein